MTAAVAVVTVASAAQLSVLSSDHQTENASSCTTQTLPMTMGGSASWSGDYAQVQVLSIPANCNNLAVSLVVYNVSGTQLTTGTGNTGATGTTTISTGSYNAASVAGVALLIDTWGVHTNWVSPDEIFTCVALRNNRTPQGGNRYCSVTGYTITGPTGTLGSQRMDITFTVDGNSQHSRVIIDFTAGVFPWTPTWVAQATPLVLQLPSPYTCPSPLTSITVEDISGSDFTATVTIGQIGAPYPPAGFSPLCP